MRRYYYYTFMPVSAHSPLAVDPGTIPAPAKSVMPVSSVAAPTPASWHPVDMRADRIATQKSLAPADMYPTGPA